MTPLLLGVIGLLLAHPVPAALGLMRWPYRVPRAAIVLWQAMALAAVLAVLGAGLSTALWLVSPPDGELVRWRVVAHFLVLALTAFVVVRLCWSTWNVARETRERRRRQRELVDVLARADVAAPGARVLAERTPIAYCVPAHRNSRVVVSSGTLAELDEDELAAVLAHERAHVRNRHDLVLEAFTALRHAFPLVPRGDAPLHQSRVMIELLADDRARREHGTLPLARALVKLADRPAPLGALGAGSAAQLRLERLSAQPRTHVIEAACAYALAAGVLVGPTVSLAVPWIAHAWSAVI
ncbi:M56 family metallopeptidase [Solicola gregarius]|uniref:M56 family metallopeptidase n=1 Tax=Solicola gregarius TaxID=2908642 RepID=A0AA46TFR7_9ACTN|nr:M56 family metallopeptidase [Solicola gregarius]UYM04368.1 M56 family metallopeptidase [Solicola gregarius]